MNGWFSEVAGAVAAWPWRWVAPVLAYLCGLLTKPLQEEISRRIKLWDQKRTSRRDIYKELAWNLRLIMTDNWLRSHAVAAEDLPTEAYERAKASGLLYEFEESSELSESIEFFKAVRSLGLSGGTTFENIVEICGEYLFGLDNALRTNRISTALLRKVSSARERELLDLFLSESAKARAAREARDRAYLARRAGDGPST
ncbi:MAG: hypothetical protein LAQ30_14420 [Acidobacteriia bacterium]|nr:hypothetical protein [Terriglobia bacterium]